MRNIAGTLVRVVRNGRTGHAIVCGKAMHGTAIFLDEDLTNELRDNERDYEIIGVDDLPADAKAAVCTVGLMDPSFDGFTKRSLVPIRKLVEQLAADGVPEALELKAYALYQGGNLYPQDVAQSRDMLELIFSRTARSDIANTLGYIYCCGGANGGVPEYDKARRYFTFGAADGLYESQYKLADMEYYGHGMPANRELAKIRYGELYDQAVEDFIEDPKGINKFADLALRMSIAESDEKNPDWYMAVKYIQEAELAIGLRMEFCKCYGDEIVASRIHSQLVKCLVRYRPESHRETNDLSFVEETFCPDGALGKAEVEVDGRFCRIRFSSVDVDDRETPYPGLLLLTIPENGFCDFVESYTVSAISCEGLETGKHTFYFDETPTAFDGELVLSLDGRVVADITASMYGWRLEG